MEKDATGLMIIRIWVDPDSPEPARAQIRLTTDVASGFQRTLSLAPDEVPAAVRQWLQDVLGPAQP
jgi:hypothetical protein